MTESCDKICQQVHYELDSAVFVSVPKLLNFLANKVSDSHFSSGMVHNIALRTRNFFFSLEILVPLLLSFLYLEMFLVKLCGLFDYLTYEKCELHINN